MPFFKEELAVAECRESWVMGDGDKGPTILPGKAEQKVDDARAGGGIEIAGGLVGKKNSRIVDQGARYRHTLLLAAAEQEASRSRER